MDSYIKKAITYSLVVVGVAVVTMLCRSNKVNAFLQWDSIQKMTGGNKAERLREFCRNWRSSKYTHQAQELLKNEVAKDLKNLDFKSEYQVRQFKEKYPEVHPDVFEKTRYDALMNDRSYETFRDYYWATDTPPKYHAVVGKMIDEMTSSEIAEAEKCHDAKRLRQLSKKYVSWKDCGALAARKADEVQRYLDTKAAEERAKAAEAAWVLVRNSRDESALRSFASKYADSRYAEIARRTADELYDDFSYVLSLNTIEAYKKYISRNPRDGSVVEANKRIIDLEVEEVAKGDHGKLSAPHRSYGYGGTGGVAKIALKNSTEYTIEVMYSGSNHSYKRSIASHASDSLSVEPGKYKVVVRAPGSDVTPFYGENDLTAGSYSEEFYIQTTRNGVPISFPSSSLPKLDFPKSSPYRRSSYR